jgi:[ribosomal protein S18]-alanine N-acetyltransferase
MIDYSDLPVQIESMRVEDIGPVLEIERLSFSAPWSARAYEYELRYNELAHYFVARLMNGAGPTRRGWNPRDWFETLFRPSAVETDPLIVGYVGFWLMVGEAHISTIAVNPSFRRRSIGELLLVAALERAMELHAHQATLEVRVSNVSAQDLYLKYGFVKAGLRKGYYTDNNEDGIIMTTPPLTSAEYQQRYQRLRDALLMHVRDTSEPRSNRAQQDKRGGSTYGSQS